MKRTEKVLWTILIVATSVLLARVMQPNFNDTNVAMIYMLAVVATAFLLGLWPAVVACLLGVVLYDFVNLPPYFTFSTHVLDYLFTLVVMLVTAFAISTQAAKLRRQAVAASEHAARTAALFSLSEDLAHDQTPEEILTVTIGHIGRAFPAEVTSGLLPAELAKDGRIAVSRDSAGELHLQLPVPGHGDLSSWIRLTPSGDWRPGADHEAHLRAMARVAEQALARTALRAEVQESASRARQEALRSSILGAVSHDLRTPLAAIIGASSTLMDESGKLVDDTRRELRQVIYDEAIHMQRMVENLLDLARIRSGDIRGGMTWQAFEEIVGGTMASIRRRAWTHTFIVDVPPDLPLIRCDGILIERVLTNLLDNAAKYSPAESRVELQARVEEDWLVVRVRDEGPGIPAELKQRVFEPFFRAGGKPGSGLGLAICRGIVEAHGGDINVGDAKGAGAELTLRLPVPDNRPGLEREEFARKTP